MFIFSYSKDELFIILEELETCSKNEKMINN